MATGKVSREQLEAILRLRTNPDFGVVVKLIADETEVLMRKMVGQDLDPVGLARMQGQVRFGTNLITTIDIAEKLYAEYTRPRT